MKETRDKRLTFSLDNISNIAMAAAYKRMPAKKFMEEAVISATLMTLVKLKKSK